MEMSVGEIKRNYDNAKNKERQISILAELNDCDRSEIEKIVLVEGKRELAEPSPAEMSLRYVINRLFLKLDELDENIKSMEAEYTAVKTAIDVLTKMEGGTK